MLDIPEIKKRYTETASEVDAFGRTIVVARLKPSQQLKAAEMAANDAAAQTIRYLCGLIQIDDDHFAFPRNRAELDARLDRLDDEGIEALMKATVKLYGSASPDGGKASVAEAAKNSSAP